MRQYIKRKSENDLELEKKEKLQRGRRIKHIRENELKINKSELARKIGVSSQFLGLVEEGKGNLTYGSIKALKILSGHSADYILYGIDDNVINETREFIKEYSEEELIRAIKTIENIALFIKNDKYKAQ